MFYLLIGAARLMRNPFGGTYHQIISHQPLVLAIVLQ
jgi:hypothetical protein